MCGFFAFSTGLSSRAIADLFGLTNIPKSLEDIQSLKFFPKSYIPTISKNSPNSLVMRYWSLIPKWWQKELTELTFSTFNARAEDIAQKATFRTAWLNNQRCLVPVTWFYEFKAQIRNDKKVKTPFRAQVINEEIFTLAGLYETWRSPNGEAIESVTVITTEASGELRDVHARQPVIIAQADREQWLTKAVSAGEVEPMLRSSEQIIVSEIDHSFNTAFGSALTEEMVRPRNTKT